jgi:hypothetical protein
MHRARAAGPRGFDSLPSLLDVGTFSFRPNCLVLLQYRYFGIFCAFAANEWIRPLDIRIFCDFATGTGTWHGTWCCYSIDNSGYFVLLQHRPDIK